MRILEERIIKDGLIYDGDVLKVGSFLNHQIDVPFMSLLCKELYERYKDSGVNKILTIEASGIGIACLTAQYFGCPAVFAKKSRTTNLSDSVYTADIASYTHGIVNTAVVEKDYLCKGDKVLIIDDFLAKGCALKGLIDIVRQSEAELVGCGIIIEKYYQGGGNEVRDMGIRVESLAKIASMKKGMITFTE